MKRKSPFIWIPTQVPDPKINFGGIIRDGAVRRDDGVNRWFLFRKSFDLDASIDFPVQPAIANIFVDGRYSLFVNGQAVGKGPARCNPHYARFDSHDLSDLLVEGENTIAILIHVYGIDTSWYQRAINYWQTIFGDGGLFFELELGSIDKDAKTTQRIIADESWRCLQTDAWTQESPKSGWGQGYIEEHDARKLPEDWKQTSFDDSSWYQAVEMIAGGDAVDIEKGFYATQPFPTMIPRGMNLLLEEPRIADRVMAVFGLQSNDSLSLDRRIYDEKITQLPNDAVQNVEALLKDDDTYTFVKTSPGIDICIMIAFSESHAAYPNINLEAQGGEVIEIAVSETIHGEYGNGMASPPRLIRSNFMDCAHLFRYIARSGEQRFEKYEWTAVKYLQLVVRNAPQGIRIKQVGSTYTIYPVEEQGAFKCSDDFLNRLWQVGSYTIAQCSHDAWEDCPGREKRQWVGDGTVRFLSSYATFGTSTQALDRNFLLQIQESQRTDGLLQMFAPGDHHGQGIIIPDYSLYWVLTVWDYFLFNDDIDLVIDVYPSVEKVLSWFKRQEDQNGLLADIPYWHFIEWANTNRRGESAMINAMYCAALNCAAKLAQHLGNEGSQKRYEARSNVVKAQLNKRHWSEPLGMYVDSVDPVSGDQAKELSQHANAAMILWDIAPTQRWTSIVNKITDESKVKLSTVSPVAKGDPDFDASIHIVKANTFFAHFVYAAIAKTGHFDLVLRDIREHYHDMITQGAETLWESVTPTASLCHAFSATPVYQLSTNSIGVSPLTPGFKRFQLFIQTGDLDFAEGIFPTPQGGISVEWSLKGDVLKLSVAVPTGTVCELKNPLGFEQQDVAKNLPAGSYKFDFQRSTV